MKKEVRNEIQKGIDKGLDALADASGWDRESLRTYILCVSIHAPHAGDGANHALGEVLQTLGEALLASTDITIKQMQYKLEK